ncbi:hypothetical protein [Streptomyces sp. MMBL 11-1]|uniref:hypothetical protein n=1 Tax=Streptomyces sp. MMBL 11-1 TaxID=3026420 RepID=UPI00235DCB18|nr:hypothetical protein [Streptomyces sp. MMBL 11-1]
MPVHTAPPATDPAPAPAEGRGPVEQAVVADALAAAGPETLVRTDIPQPDGRVRLYASWTDRSGPLADRIDRLALARGLDAWSWVEILTHHQHTTHRGRIEVRTHPLRQVLADVERGHHGNEEHRANFARLLADNAEQAGRPPLPAPGLPAWPGIGPRHRQRTSAPATQPHRPGP